MFRITGTKMKIEIYTKPSCPFCVNAKVLIQSNGHEYIEYILGENGVDKQTIVDRLNGKNVTTVPQIFIDDQHIGGYTDLVAHWKK